jgi:twitching motility protein PilJ
LLKATDDLAAGYQGCWPKAVACTSLLLVLVVLAALAVLALLAKVYLDDTQRRAEDAESSAPGLGADQSREPGRHSCA